MAHTLTSEQFSQLIDTLWNQDYSVLGPVVRDGAIVLEELRSASQLPQGWIDDQEAGTYRIEKKDDPEYFRFTNGQHSWKQFLLPSKVQLLTAKNVNGKMQISEDPVPAPKYAFIGVRPCDLAAIKVQDRVLMGDEYRDPIYVERRKNALIICVKCTRAGGTCFCASMGSGPEPGEGYDLALTELADDGGHRFVVDIGTSRGAELIASLGAGPASEMDVKQARQRVEETASHMGRTLRQDNLAATLLNNFEHPHWECVANRCLACGNCTLVCPTCFCTTVEDKTELLGQKTERRRLWDSCFTFDFTYIHGGSVRASTMSRYRQWITHKLATWWQQFGTSGCIGCGRCITWCPVGIDITEEAKAIRLKNRADSKQGA